jgi:transposase-like protein
MTNSKRPYKTFTHEFKLEAVRLMIESNRPTAEIATELAILVCPPLSNACTQWHQQAIFTGSAECLVLLYVD